MSYPRIGYTGSTPGADSNTYVLFATILPATPTDAQNANWPQNMFMLADVHKFCLLLKNNQSGTINIYESEDRGVTWQQVDTLAVSAAASTGSNPMEFLVEGMKDMKIEWVNGGSAQTTWSVNMSLSSDRAAAV